MTKVTQNLTLTRRRILQGSLVAGLWPTLSNATTAREISWDDLIPADLPYPQIIGEGFMDEQNDVWRPIYDENGKKFVEELSGQYIRLPGFIIPMEMDSDGVTEFLLVPYVGACIHTPPPPANQLVVVTTKKPWPSEDLWDAVWVIGTLGTKLQTSEIAESGYVINADEMEIYEW